MIKNLLKHSLFGLIFFLPISTSFIFWDNSSYFWWNFSSFSAFIVSLSDIFLIFSLFFYFILILKNWEKKIAHFKFFNFLELKTYFWNIEKKFNLLFFIFFISLFIPFFFAKDFVLHLFLTFKFSSILFLFFYVSDDILSKKNIWNLLLFSFLFQWIISFYQFFFQSSIWLSFLWESLIWKNELWIAKFSIWEWEKIIRAYWTTKHSNILWISSVIAFYLANFSSFKFLKYLLIFPILFSFSRIAIFLLILIIILEFILQNKFSTLFSKKNKINFLVFISWIWWLIYYFLDILKSRFSFLDSSFSERIEQFKISFEMFLENPFWVWFWNYLLNAQNFSEKIIKPWEFQPVHNFIFLFWNELWVVALALFFTIILFLFKNSNTKKSKKIILFLLLIIPISWEHFFLTSTIWITLLAILLRLI